LALLLFLLLLLLLLLLLPRSRLQISCRGADTAFEEFLVAMHHVSFRNWDDFTPIEMMEKAWPWDHCLRDWDDREVNAMME